MAKVRTQHYPAPEELDIALAQSEANRHGFTALECLVLRKVLEAGSTKRASRSLRCNPDLIKKIIGSAKRKHCKGAMRQGFDLRLYADFAVLLSQWEAAN